MHYCTEYGGQFAGGRAHVHPGTAHHTAAGLPHRGLQTIEHFGLHIGFAQCHQQPGDPDAEPDPEQYPNPDPQPESHAVYETEPDTPAEAISRSCQATGSAEAQDDGHHCGHVEQRLQQATCHGQEEFR